MMVRITWRRAVAALAFLILAGLAFAWSGLFQVSASSGHWAVTDWFLHWTMRNSVRTHAALDPPLDRADAEELVSAAGHYRQACQVCHGAPGVRPSAAMQRATPPAPDLAHLDGKWSDRELGWIIEHGIKMTGMPAWGAAGRRDEVARMTAFVKRLPMMTPQAYRALTDGEPSLAVSGIRTATLAACAGCHGSDGRGRGQGDIPILGGQSFTYLRAALMDYAEGRRPSAVMQVATGALTSQEIDALARHYAAMPGVSGELLQPNSPSLILRGDPLRQLPACTSCHGASKAGPRLAGQKAPYLAARLRAWRGAEQVVDARKSAATMAVIARRIPAERIDELAAALAGGGSADQSQTP